MQDVTIEWNLLTGIWYLCIIFESACELTMISTLKWLIVSGQNALGGGLSWKEWLIVNPKGDAKGKGWSVWFN